MRAISSRMFFSRVGSSRAASSRLMLSACLAACSVLAFGCSSSSSTATQPVQTIATSGSNVQAIQVNTGADPSSFEYVDGAFTSVTVCAPGSTTNCQTIPDILIDTGSSGLRVLSSALTISLPAQTSSSNSVAECAEFEDGVTWGAVDTADVKISGELASSLPVQVIGSSNFPTVPTDCTAVGVPEDDLASLGANGLLGIGQAIQDCGQGCAVTGATPTNDGAAYYTCPSSTCAEIPQSLALQVQNPVASFATDNNGVILELPAVTVGTPQLTLNGSLIFGIGTQSNNSLGSATVYGTDEIGDLVTTYNSTTNTGFLDSGSNGIYFLDTGLTGLPLCTGQLNFWYCPTTTQTVSVVNKGLTNNSAAPASFSVGNAVTLTNNNDAAINGIGGPLMPQLFDFGLPFFYGRNVFVAIDGKTTPGGTGPYTAY